MKLLLNTLLYGLIIIPLQSCGAEAEDAVNFILTGNDIQAMEELDNNIWIQLTPAVASELQAITEGSYNKKLLIEIDGTIILETFINATIESGVIQIDSPSANVRNKIKEVTSNIEEN